MLSLRSGTKDSLVAYPYVPRDLAGQHDVATNRERVASTWIFITLLPYANTLGFINQQLPFKGSAFSRALISKLASPSWLVVASGRSLCSRSLHRQYPECLGIVPLIAMKRSSPPRSGSLSPPPLKRKIASTTTSMVLNARIYSATNQT